MLFCQTLHKIHYAKMYLPIQNKPRKDLRGLKFSVVAIVLKSIIVREGTVS